MPPVPKIAALILWTLVVWPLAMSRNAAADLMGFHIGNSLTWGAISPGLPSVVEALGGALSIGYHIRCGSPLGNIVAEPSVVCVPTPAPYGNWQHALTQYEWDYVTLQTHAGMAADELQAASDVVSIATAGGRNVRTRFFIYSAWPTRSDTQTYREVRTQGLTSTALNTNAFLGTLHSSLAATHPDVSFGYIPAGEVLLRLDDLLRASPVAGLTSAWDLYGDSLHLNDTGRYVAYATIAAVLTGRDPADLTFSAGILANRDPALVALANAAIAEVIASDSRVNALAVPEPGAMVIIGNVVCFLLTRTLASSTRGLPTDRRHG